MAAGPPPISAGREAALPPRTPAGLTPNQQWTRTAGRAAQGRENAYFNQLQNNYASAQQNLRRNQNASPVAKGQATQRMYQASRALAAAQAGQRRLGAAIERSSANQAAAAGVQMPTWVTAPGQITPAQLRGGARQSLQVAQEQQRIRAYGRQQQAPDIRQDLARPATAREGAQDQRLVQLGTARSQRDWQRAQQAARAAYQRTLTYA
jgi:hypothetical protein